MASPKKNIQGQICSDTDLQSWANCGGKCQKHEITIVVSTE